MTRDGQAPQSANPARLRAFCRDGDDVGVLLCHGFTGSPQGVRPLAQAFAHAGHTVRLPLLPGHGTTWQDCNKTTWRQWYAEVESGFVDLRSRCRIVIAVGLSMGGALAIRLAQLHPDDIAGLVLINPALRVDDPRMIALPALQWVLPSLPGVGNDVKKVGGEPEWCYDRLPLRALASQTTLWRLAAAGLPQVRMPVLLAHSTQDHVVPASSWQLVRERIGSTDVTDLALTNSYHVATLDNDAELLEREALAFVDRIASRGPA
ncbi:MAG: alpha/beta fold hydrolase [Micrococcales bacterium]|nr:alpha/beta fold hydrolase [Micrococcales bacterium]